MKAFRFNLERLWGCDDSGGHLTRDHGRRYLGRAADDAQVHVRRLKAEQGQGQSRGVVRWRAGLVRGDDLAAQLFGVGDLGHGVQAQDRVVERRTDHDQIQVAVGVGGDDRRG